jgi:hypothetical protein
MYKLTGKWYLLNILQPSLPLIRYNNFRNLTNRYPAFWKAFSNTAISEEDSEGMLTAESIIFSQPFQNPKQRPEPNFQHRFWSSCASSRFDLPSYIWCISNLSAKLGLPSLTLFWKKICMELWGVGRTLPTVFATKSWMTSLFVCLLLALPRSGKDQRHYDALRNWPKFAILYILGSCEAHDRNISHIISEGSHTEHCWRCSY